MYRKGYHGWLKHIDFILLDLVALELAFLAAYFIRFGSINLYADTQYASLDVVYLLADIVVALAFNSYKNVLKRGFYKELVALVKHLILLEAVVLFYLFSVQQSSMYSRVAFYLVILFYAVLTYLIRIFWKEVLHKKAERSPSNMVIVAPAERLADCMEHICGDANLIGGYRCVGVVPTEGDANIKEVGGVPVLCKYEDIIDEMCNKWVDEVFLYTAPGSDLPLELAARLNGMGITTHIAVARCHSILDSKQLVEPIGGTIFLTHTLNIISPGAALMKRLMDIVGALLGSIVTILIAIILWPIMKIASPGPLFFVQERIGRNGRHFKMIKFRSMYMDAEERKAELMNQNRMNDDKMFKLDFDPRIIGNRILPDGRKKTGIGQFLRNTSIDEFPQFFNVLVGDMSLVGTRPPTVDEWEKYEPHHRARMSFRPGITGLWQIRGRSDITDFDEVVRLDMEYIDAWSVGLDVKILLKTIGVIVKKDGAR